MTSEETTSICHRGLCAKRGKFTVHYSKMWTLIVNGFFRNNRLQISPMAVCETLSAKVMMAFLDKKKKKILLFSSSIPLLGSAQLKNCSQVQRGMIRKADAAPVCVSRKPGTVCKFLTPTAWKIIKKKKLQESLIFLDQELKKKHTWKYSSRTHSE